MVVCVSDPFMSHFEIDLDDKVAEELSGCKTCQKEEVKVCYSKYNKISKKSYVH